jgi:hypothetical protein
MSRVRRSVVHALMVVVLGGNLASLFFDTQVWPYSPYAMFADARAEHLRTLQTLVLVGESADGEEFWFERQGYLGRAISPMILGSVFTAAQARGRDAVQRRLREAYDLYERQRSQGPTDAPPLRRIVLYRFTWRLQPNLSNVRAPARARLASYPPDGASAP